MKRFSDTLWNTGKEIDFIDSLGHQESSTINRKVLLRGYIVSMEKRSTWGDIDRSLCLYHAQQALLSETV